jgi:molybdopterin molybdotransferase
VGSGISFFKAKTRAEVLADLAGFAPLPVEVVPLIESSGRVLAEDVIAPEDVPGFDRSTMDGFAVRAAETFGAGEGSPALFEVAGEVPMGAQPTEDLSPGRAVRIWTGGMLPPGADAVVMLEYSRELDDTTVELIRAVAPGENVIQRGDDVKVGSRLLPQGHRLRPQDVGLLAALGRVEVPVHRRPRVAVLSTGDEVVPVDVQPGPGQVRDVNAYTLASLAAKCGAESELLGLVGDDPEAIRRGVARGVAAADVVLVSGGSSVGRRDFTLDTFLSFDGAELLVHGVSVSPGKPTILVRLGRQSLWGLPGHVTSAMIVFDLFVRPLLARLSGGTADREAWRPRVLARLGRNLPSVPGREDFVRVRLEATADGPVAWPILGASGLLATMIRADGVIRVPLHDEGLMRDEVVEVTLFE